MVKVLVKALRVVEFLSGQEHDAGVSEIGRAVGLDKVTVFRLLQTLVREGYVEHDPDSGRYRLGVKLWEIGSRVVGPQRLGRAANEALKGLATASGETAYLAVASGTEAIFLDKVDSQAAVRIHTPLGARIPLHCGSASKALLAWQPEEVIARVCADLRPLTPFTITDPQALRADLATIRRRGYSVASQEWREGISGVAAPIRDGSGTVVAALAVSGPSNRLTATRTRQLAPAVVSAARGVSARLGWSGGAGAVG